MRVWRLENGHVYVGHGDVVVEFCNEEDYQAWLAYEDPDAVIREGARRVERG